MDSTARPPADPHPPIGRPEVVSAIDEALTSGAAGRGSLLLLVGEEGVGKSTFLDLAVRRGAERGFRTALARALPHEFPQPFAMVQELLGEFREGERGGTDEDPGSFSLLLAPLERGPRPAEDSADGAGPGRGPDPPRLLSALSELPRRSGRNRFLVLDRVIEDLTRLAARQPILLAIDDLQFADDSSVEFVEQIAHRVEGKPIVLVATLFPPPHTPVRLQRCLASLQPLPIARWQPIRPLSSAEVGDYVSALRGGGPVSPDEVLAWHRRTGGNPLVVEQFLRGPPLAGAPAGQGPPEELPLIDVDRARIARLPEPALRALCYAAVVGKRFDLEVLGRALGRETEDVSAAVDALVAAGLVREGRPGTFEFVRESLRREQYAGLTESRRRILHRNIAEALEERRSAPPAVFELARHSYLARDWARAVDYSRRAADLSTAAFAYPEARLHLERALESARNLASRDPLEEWRIEVELGRVLDAMGELRPAVDVLSAAVDSARADDRIAPELAIATLWLATAHGHLWEHERARALAQESLAQFDRLGNDAGRAAAHRVIGLSDWDTGHFAEGELHHRQAAEIAARLGDTHLEAHALIDLANLLIFRGPPVAEQALALYDRAEALLRPTHDASSLARVAMNRAVLLNSLGRRAEALRSIDEAERHAEASRSLLWRVYTALNEATFRAEAGESVRVRQLVERARELNHRLRDRLSDEQIAVVEGIVLENESDPARARDRYLEALRLAEELDMVPDVLEVRLRLARLAWSQRDLEEARSQLQRALDDGIDTVRADLRGPTEQLLTSLAAAGVSVRRGAPGAAGTSPGRTAAG